MWKSPAAAGSASVGGDSAAPADTPPKEWLDWRPELSDRPDAGDRGDETMGLWCESHLDQFPTRCFPLQSSLDGHPIIP